MKISANVLERMVNEYEAEILDDVEDEVEAAYQRVARKHFISAEQVRELYLTTRDAESFGCVGVMQ